MTTYTPDSPILGQGQATAAQIDAWFAAKGRALAANYAPDGQYKAPPVGLGQTIINACAIYPGVTVNHDLVAGQVCDETAGWQSKYARERNNPGGIGAINNDPDQAITFPSVAAGVEAHVAHLLDYAVGTGQWSADDPRHDAIRDAGWLGVCRVLRDLNGRWAFPGPTYGQNIAALANDLLSTTAGQTPPASGRVPKPPMRTDVRAVKFDGYSTPRKVEALCKHISNGHEAGDLQQLTQVVSSNYYINRAGVIYELVDPHLHSAWTNGQVKGPDLSNPLIAKWVAAGINPNTRTVSTEHEGMTTDGAGGELTAAQWESTQALDAWLCQEFDLPADRMHIIGHYQIDSVTRSYCPGFSDAEWADHIRKVQARMSGTGPVDPNSFECPNGTFIINATIDGRVVDMLNRWQKRGGVAVCGYAMGGMTGVMEGDQLTYRQLFENVGIAIYPDGSDRFYGIGQELVACRAKAA